MILFLNEERAYRSWVAHHRQGFVLDGRRRPTLSRLVLHRATCPAIKTAPSRRYHWTTGAKLKACSLDRGELEAWLAEQKAPAPLYCASCRPDSGAGTAKGGELHSSKLGREILDYVLDAAVIHLEHEYPPYRLTVGDIAACFAKTPGQLASALDRLREDGLLVIGGLAGGRADFAPTRIVLPTSAALRTLEAFQNEGAAALDRELAKLQATD